jgi:DNA-binding MarR family transcriptional regulator
MLKNVLREIYEAKLFSKSLIGKNLNISEEMVDELVNQLIRLGYITEEMGSPTCEGKCAGCSISSCKSIPIKMISVTEKGKKLLNKENK